LLLLPVRITQRKNIELALRMMGELRQIMPQSVLVITGPVGAHNPANVAYFDSLKALKKDLGLGGAVYFLAEEWPQRLADNVIADLFRMADALFLPSWEEGFGIPVIEAALLGKQIFASSIGSLMELAGEDAIYFPPDGEPAKIAKLTAGAIHGSSIQRQRVRVRQHFSWEAIYANRIAPLIEAVNGAA
jgi:glycosyltransferase involved in cell wall biosynthesis